MRRYITQQAQLVRALSGGIGKTAVIYPAAFLVSLAVGQLALGLVLYAKVTFAASSIQVGLLAGIWSLTYLAGCLFVRPLFYRTLPRYLIMGSTALMGLLVLGMVAATAFIQLFWAYALFGLALALFWPSIMGWLSSDSEGARLGRVISRYNLAWCSAAAFSPFLCGWLFEHRPTYPLILAAGLLLVVCTLVAGASLALPRVRGDRGGTSPRPDEAARGPDRSSPLRFPAWLGLFGSFAGMGLLTAVFPLAALDTWRLPETLIGLLFLARGLTNAVGFVLLGQVHGWHHRRLPMLLGQALGILALGGLALGQSLPLLALALALYGFSMAMSYAGSLFHGASGSLHRARRMAIHESMLAAGLVTGSALGGWIYQYAGRQIVFGAAAAFLAACTLLQLALSRPTRHTTRPTNE